MGTLRDKLSDLAKCGVDQTVVLPFNAALAGLSPQDFITKVLVQGLGARYVLVGDDFRFGKARAGDYALLDAAGEEHGFDVARMNSYEVHNLRVSSSLVREALGQGRMADALDRGELGREAGLSRARARERQVGPREHDQGREQQPGDHLEDD